ncbi:hypothetical protein F5B18DRAFT_371638 [Nemania serpens]|nr:hypothetical protein F5B18DRAFT_371638 [Nemania serpens]
MNYLPYTNTLFLASNLFFLPSLIAMCRLLNILVASLKIQSLVRRQFDQDPVQSQKEAEFFRSSSVINILHRFMKYSTYTNRYAHFRKLQTDVRTNHCAKIEWFANALLFISGFYALYYSFIYIPTTDKCRSRRLGYLLLMRRRAPVHGWIGWWWCTAPAKP